jgi:hypothetical protein
VNTEQKFGPFYFEVSDKVADLPSIAVDDESGIFKLAGQVGTTTDQEGRRRISFDLIATPKEVLRAPRYMIKVSLDGGEPAYYMLVCNLNVNPLVYFPTPVVRLSETETVVIVKCSKEPSNVRWEMTSQALDVEWRWNTDLAVGELLVRRPEILSNESFVDLTIVATIEGQEEAATCSLVPVPSD